MGMIQSSLTRQKIVGVGIRALRRRATDEFSPAFQGREDERFLFNRRVATVDSQSSPTRRGDIVDADPGVETPG